MPDKTIATLFTTGGLICIAASFYLAPGLILFSVGIIAVAAATFWIPWS